MKREFAQIRDLRDGKKDVRDCYNGAVDHFSERFGIPKKDFPRLRIIPGTDEEVYDQVDNEVHIGDQSFIADIGDAIGEELGHYVRARLMGFVGQEIEDQEAHADEFLGFLGSRILYQDFSETDRKRFFAHGERTFEKNYEGVSYPEERKELVRLKKQGGKSSLQRLKNLFRIAEQEGDEDKMQEIYNEAEERDYEEYVSSLIHVRPYHFASDVDLDQVGDLKELYQMPDKKIRKRFFRESHGGLEKKAMGFVGIAGLALSLIFISSNLTGLTIFNFVNRTTNLFGGILFLIGILGSYFWFKG